MSSSPILRCILNGIRYWEWKNGTVGFSQFGGAFHAKDASGQRNIAADYACVEARVNLTTFCVAFVGRKEDCDGRDRERISYFLLSAPPEERRSDGDSFGRAQVSSDR